MRDDDTCNSYSNQNLSIKHAYSYEFTRCKFPDDVALHTSQVESSTIHVLVALVKAERKRAAALENVAEFLTKRKEQSNALFNQAKEEMEEARKKLAKADQVRRLLLSKTVVNTNFPS